MAVLVSFNFNQDLLTQFDEEEVLVIFDELDIYIREKKSNKTCLCKSRFVKTTFLKIRKP